MSSSKTKAKAKKVSAKKEHQHDIPAAKTAKGRRPHTEAPVEPYQPSLLSESDMEPQQKAQSHVADEVAAAQQPEAAESMSATGQEQIIHGEPAPQSQRKKVELKEHIESVKGVVQMGAALMKTSFPKPFELAEKVVEDWKQDGDFSELPINQPLVQFYVGLGLRKVKQTEKQLEQKLETAGVLPVVRQQLNKAQKYFK